MKQARRHSTDEGTERWKKPRTMAENLQGSKELLSSTLNELSQSVAALESLTPKVARLTSMAQIERKYEMVTLKDIEEARTVVIDSTRPEAEKLLSEAQSLIDQQIFLFSQLEQKVDGQDTTLTTQDATAEKQWMQQERIETETQDKRQRQKLLSVEYNRCDTELAGLELELKKVEEKVKRKQEQIKQKEAKMERRRLDDAKQQKESAEEQRLVDELKQIEEQLKKQEMARAKLHNKDSNVQTDLDTKDDGLLDIDRVYSDLTQDNCQKRLSYMQEILDGLQNSTVSIYPKQGDLPQYLEVVQQYQAKYSQSIQQDEKPEQNLEQKVENNIGLLKTYCKTLMPQDNMGFIAQRLIDVIFTKDGYSAMTKDQILQKFGSSRQKEVVKKLLDRLDLSFIE